MKQKRKRDEKREPQTPQWSQPTGVIGTKPPPEQRSYKGWGWGKLYVRSTSPPEPEITDPQNAAGASAVHCALCAFPNRHHHP